MCHGQTLFRGEWSDEPLIVICALLISRRHYGSGHLLTNPILDKVRVGRSSRVECTYSKIKKSRKIKPSIDQNCTLNNSVELSPRKKRIHTANKKSNHKNDKKAYSETLPITELCDFTGSFFELYVV